jgi:XRE family aerobic/anaerobic benzoate catabolism transcriptional regulator
MARDICVTLGKRIRELRKARGWRQLDLAEEADISENYVADIEFGRKAIGIRTLKAVANALDLKIVDLMRGVE